MLPPKMSAPWPLYSGDPSSLPLDFTEGVPAVPRTLTGTYVCQWRKSAGAAESLVLAIDDTLKAAGRLVVQVTGEQTAAMGGPGGFDIQEVDGPTLLRGATSWELDYTRV